MTQPIAGNQFFTQVHNRAAQLPELDVAELNVVNAVLMSGLTVSTITGNPNLALTASAGTITATALQDVILSSGSDIHIEPSTLTSKLKFFAGVGTNPTDLAAGLPPALVATTQASIIAAAVANAGDGGAAALTILLPVLVAYGLLKA